MSKERRGFSAQKNRTREQLQANDARDSLAKAGYAVQQRQEDGIVEQKRTRRTREQMDADNARKAITTAIDDAPADPTPKAALSSEDILRVRQLKAAGVVPAEISKLTGFSIGSVIDAIPKKKQTVVGRR